MKKNDILIPIVLAGIVLIIAIVTAITKEDFKRSPTETLLMVKDSKYLIGTTWISSIPADQLVIIKIGAGKQPFLSSAIEVKGIDFNQILSAETKALLSDNKKKKIFFSNNLTDAIKTWTFLTRMGYNELYVFDPDAKNPAGQTDSILHGNEELQYTFKPEKTEAE